MLLGLAFKRAQLGRFHESWTIKLSRLPQVLDGGFLLDSSGHEDCFQNLYAEALYKQTFKIIPPRGLLLRWISVSMMVHPSHSAATHSNNHISASDVAAP